MERKAQKRGFFKIEDELILKNPLEPDLNCAKAARESCQLAGRASSIGLVTYVEIGRIR